MGSATGALGTEPVPSDALLSMESATKPLGTAPEQMKVIRS